MDLRRWRIGVQLLRESVLMTLQNIWNNKLRTLLSLLGVTIGIFTIVAIFIVLDSFQSDMRNIFAGVRNETLFIQKWPWGPPPDQVPWYEIMLYPEVSFDDYRAIRRHSRHAGLVTIASGFTGTVRIGKKYIRQASVNGIWRDHVEVMGYEVRAGRLMNDTEYDQGEAVCVLGAKIADQLFKSPEEAVGSTVRIRGFATQVVGVLKPNESIYGFNDSDNSILIPYFYLRKFGNLRRMYGQLMVDPKPGVTMDRLEDDIVRVMRSERGLRPSERNNFFVNRMESLNEQFDMFFKGLNKAGVIIALFSVLVGGFGIANIMFVSVRERTRIIGIQKSLGATRHFILFQFFFEALLLSLLGGILGLLLIFLTSLLLAGQLPFPLLFTAKHVLIGLGISLVIGVVSGYVPARSASEMDPIRAINTLA